LDEKWRTLTAGKNELKKLTQVITDQVVAQISTEKPHEPDEVVLDVTRHTVKGDVSGSDMTVKIIDASGIPIVMNKRVFERLIGLSIATALIEAEKAFHSTDNGWDLVCELGTEACLGWMKPNTSPGSWSEERSKGIFTKAVGESFEKLNYIPPAIRDLLSPFMIPNAYTSVPLQLYRSKPVAQDLLDRSLDPNMLMGQFDYLIGGALKESIEWMYCQGNLYDMMNDQIGVKIKEFARGLKEKVKGRASKKEEENQPAPAPLSDQEQAFRLVVAHLAFDLLKEFSPEWHETLDETRYQEMFGQFVVETVVPSIKASLEDQIGKKEFSKEQLFEWTWKRTAESLARDEKVTKEEGLKYNTEAKESLQKLEDVLEPVKKHTTKLGFAIGFVGHLLHSAFVKPIIWVVDQIVLALDPVNFKNTGWYDYVHKAKAKRMRRAQIKDYNTVNDLLKNPDRIRTIFDETLAARMELVERDPQQYNDATTRTRLAIIES